MSNLEASFTVTSSPSIAIVANNTDSSQYLSVDSTSLNTSPSASTFLPDQTSSTCLLLPNSPSPDPELRDPLTPGLEDANSDHADNGGDDGDTNSSSGSSGGINMVVMIPQNETDPNDEVFINNRKGNGTCVIHRKNGGFQNEDKQSVTKIGDIIITCTDNIPPFVNWNWPLIRKWSFSLFICINIGVIGFVIAMMSTLPKSCNPPVPWYQGSVFYEIFPASFQDSNDDGIGDIQGINSRVQYLKQLGVGAIRLNSIYPSKHYPEAYQDTKTYFSIDHHLGDFNDFEALVINLQRNNIALILDLPLLPLVKKLHVSEHVSEIQGQDTKAAVEHHLSAPGSTTSDNLILKAIKFWTDKGVDGFFIKDLEHFHNDSFLVSSIKEWKYMLGSDRCLIVSSNLIDIIQHNKTLLGLVMPHVDLVDVRLTVEKSAKEIVEEIETAIKGPAGLGATTWLHWSINSLEATHTRVSSLALIFLELMLPGTPNIFYGDEISLTEVLDTNDDHKETQHLHHLPVMQFNTSRAFTDLQKVAPWLPKSKFNPNQFTHLTQIKELIQLRRISPALYLKQIEREDRSYQNTNLRSSQDDLIVIERHYPRRKSFAVFTNRVNHTLKTDLSSTFYSGDIIFGTAKNSKIYFSDFEISGLETIIVKLDK
uniref:CSON011544 protein n=1 Tax=Culicoides sonorensis TaxID=179676 RepID=A0A336M3K7_CULSO